MIKNYEKGGNLMSLWIYDPMLTKNYNYTPFHSYKELSSFLKRKKINVNIFYDESTLPEIINDEDAVIYSEAKPDDFMINFISKCNANNIPILFHSPVSSLPGCYYSSFWSDSNLVILNILSYLMQNGKRKIAYFGACNSLTDNTNIASLFVNYPEFDYEDIFYITEDSIDDCIADFLKVRHHYDSVICSNDMIGTFFLARLKEIDPDYSENTFVVSFMNSILSQIGRTKITSSSFSRSKIPQVVLHMYRSFLKSKDMIKTYTITLETKLYCRETSNFTPYNPAIKYIPDISSSPKLYSPKKSAPKDTKDPNLLKLIKLESLLRSSEKHELLFFYMLLKGNSIEEICSENFISPQTVTYRSGIIYKMLGVKNRKELKEFYLKYISLKNFKNYIDTL